MCETLDGGLAAVLRVGPGSHLEVRGKGWGGQSTTWRGSSPLTGRIHDERVVDDRIKPVLGLVGKKRGREQSRGGRDGGNANDVAVGNLGGVDDLAGQL